MMTRNGTECQLTVLIDIVAPFTSVHFVQEGTQGIAHVLAQVGLVQRDQGRHANDRVPWEAGSRGREEPVARHGGEESVRSDHCRQHCRETAPVVGGG